MCGICIKLCFFILLEFMRSLGRFYKAYLLQTLSNITQIYLDSYGNLQHIILICSIYFVAMREIQCENILAGMESKKNY